jgi:hypothetical protein
MAMIANIAEPATPVALDGAFVTVPRAIGPQASRARSLASSLNIHGPSLVVVPDKVDAILKASGEASGKGRLKAALDAGTSAADGSASRRRPI